MKIVLVTADNFSCFILPEAPLHEAYQYLSETHKSDYLRTYFMHFYGGGYSDIKLTTKSWLQAWKDLFSNDTAYGNGYREIGPQGLAPVKDPTMNRILQEHWREVLGNCNYIFKPRTPFTTEWYNSMIKILDEKLDQLKQYPSRYPQEVYSPDYPYPLRLYEILGEIFHPLCYKYRSRLMMTVPMFQIADYR